MNTGDYRNEFEEMMARGLSNVLPSERPQAEERMLDLILQGHFQTEAFRKGSVKSKEALRWCKANLRQPA